MRVKVTFYSYFKDLAGCAQVSQTLPEGSTLGDLLRQVQGHFPKLAGTQKSILMAVGVEYQRADYLLQENDEVSLFPPVQGG